MKPREAVKRLVSPLSVHLNTRRVARERGQGIAALLDQTVNNDAWQSDPSRLSSCASCTNVFKAKKIGIM
jgi:hypothetical protein